MQTSFKVEGNELDVVELSDDVLLALCFAAVYEMRQRLKKQDVRAAKAVEDFRSFLLTAATVDRHGPR